MHLAVFFFFLKGIQMLKSGIKYHYIPQEKLHVFIGNAKMHPANTIL